MLGLIAQFAPSLLRNEIVKKSTSLSWIWKRIRKHYSFNQSEVNFLRLSTIKREDSERYETFFQRIVAHLEDNLITVASGLQHNGAIATQDEEMSPTTERLAVYLWLNLIDKRLPAYVSRIYAHDLQTKSVKDIQPMLADAMDSLLAEITAQEDIQISYARSSFNNNYKRSNNSRSVNVNNRNSSIGKQPQSGKNCVICKAAGRQHQNHDLSDCWFLSKVDKMEIAKTLRVVVDDESFALDNNNDFETETQHVVNKVSIIKKVQVDISPFLYMFYKHHPCHVVIDTGATSSVISRSFVQASNIKPVSTCHSARSADKSPLDVKGEVHITLNFGGMDLPVSALIVDSLDCDVLVGIPFCKQHDISVHLKSETITFNDSSLNIPYGGKSQGSGSTHKIYRVDSSVLRNDSAKVLLPGEFVEVQTKDMQHFDGEIAIEPRIDSPLNGKWPAPGLSRVIQGFIRIPNLGDELVKLDRSQHLAQIRRVIESKSKVVDIPEVEANVHLTDVPKSTLFSSCITVDPDNQLSKKEYQEFVDLHKSYDRIFDPKFEAYNDRSGIIRASINIGPVEPPPRKGKLPLYNQNNLHQLQEEADKLESLGVLVKPEDVGLTVKYVSPSFLVKKQDGGHRMVTAFNDLGQFTRILPTASTSTGEVLRKLASWKYLIKTDMTKSFYQIKVSKKSMPYLGTVTPYKGLRLYARAAMGMPGSSEYLQELMSRVFGDFLEEGFLVIIADDMYVGANSLLELIYNWLRILQRLEENNLRLSATKTVICPITTTILGWTWSAGTLSPSAHKIAPLSVVEPPKTATSMKSFIGAYKALSICIPKYASLIAPLEDSIKGLQGAQLVPWSDELYKEFTQVQNVLKSPKTITIPKPSDKLIITVDASPVNNGLSGTLFLLREEKRLVAGYYSFKLKSHQINWLPCEHKALAISCSINHFSSYIRESNHTTQVLTDSKPCVQAYDKLCKGYFSASARVSTFLSTLSSYKVILSHIPGKTNTSSDYGSRNPVECNDTACQICKFVQEMVSCVVQAITVNDILSGASPMPFMNSTAWKTAQHDCPALRRVYAHLSQGTRPTKKAKNLKDVKRYLNIASINEKGLLIVRKSDPLLHEKQLIIVPKDIIHGVVTALHLQLKHPSKHQITKLFNRYYYGLNSTAIINDVVDNCDLCTSLKKMPLEMFSQTTSPSPASPGQLFFVDVMKRAGQKIFVACDVFSSFASASIIPDETADSLRSGILLTTSLLHCDNSTVRVDGATGFLALKSDRILQSHGITLEYGQTKNKNKNAIIDKCIQELEDQFLRNDPSGGPVSTLTLQLAVDVLNTRIRNRGFSAKEILLQRDQHTRMQLNFDDESLAKKQELKRNSNHVASAVSKARHHPPAQNAEVTVGNLVYIKEEGSKNKVRDRYMITKIVDNMASLQKIGGKFMSRKYELPLTHIYPIVSANRKEKGNYDWDNIDQNNNGTSSDEGIPAATSIECANQPNDVSEEESDYVPSSSDNEETEQNEIIQPRPQRERKEPAWLADEVWDRT